MALLPAQAAAALAHGLLELPARPQTNGQLMAAVEDTANLLALASSSSPMDLAGRDAVTNVNRLARAIAAEARKEPIEATRDRVRALATELAAVPGLEDGPDRFDDAGDLAYWRRAVVDTVAAIGTVQAAALADCAALARRASTLADDMHFEFLYDRRKRIFSIGFHLPDSEGPGKPDGSFYDLLASEARVASFVAISKGEVPQHHWFHLGRPVTNVRGRATLVSWGGTMFEYLMPLLLMRTFPGTLLDQSCRASLLRQIDYARQRGIPWGISESAYAFTDRSGNYQYRAFGVPGLGLKRGLENDLVIAPYATALAALINPAAAAENFTRLVKEGLDGRFGFYESLDYRPRNRDIDADPGAVAAPAIVRAFFAHHQGMSLVAIANVICDDAFVARFHADPRVQASELLLQERVPREAILSEPRPAESASGIPSTSVYASRRFRSPHTTSPHTQFLSNGRYTAALTHAGGGYSTWRGLTITRQREDRTSDAGAHFIYLRDPWSGHVWSPTYQPICQEPDSYEAIFDLDKVTYRARNGDFETQLQVTVSSEDDVEVRRLSIVNRGNRPREIEVTSYAEIALARAEDDFAHPTFGKLFIETEFDAQSVGLLFSRRPRGADEAETAYASLAVELAGTGDPDAPAIAVLRSNDEVAALRSEVERLRASADELDIAKSRFLGVVSHELRTPLNAIIGFSDMLEHEMFGPFADPRQKEYAGLIRESGNHLLAVVTSILDVSKIECGTYPIDPEPFQFTDAVRTCTSMIAAQASAKSLTLEIEVAANVGKIAADRRAVQQMLINLLSNAVKFTPTGGTVTIGANRLGSRLHFWVNDTGIGIGQEDLGRLGRPFTQVRNDYTREYDGAGLGLSLVKGLVALHDGSMMIESAPGEGTLVTISLPVAGPAKRSAEDESSVIPLSKDEVADGQARKIA